MNSGNQGEAQLRQKMVSVSKTVIHRESGGTFWAPSRVDLHHTTHTWSDSYEGSVSQALKYYGMDIAHNPLLYSYVEVIRWQLDK